MKPKRSSRSSSRPFKATSAVREIARLEDIPNVGPAVAADLRRLGITSPGQLAGRDPYAMYDDLCRLTGQRPDPCLLDTFIAAVRLCGFVIERVQMSPASERYPECEEAVLVLTGVSARCGSDNEEGEG